MAGVVCAVMPVFGLDPAPCIVLLPFALFHHSLPSSLFPLPSFLPCVHRHGIVGLGWCLCGRVVLLRKGGDGLCWVEGRCVRGCGVLP